MLVTNARQGSVSKSVLELAVSAQASYIITHNLRNFAGVESFGIEAITPAQLLMKMRELK
jgi:hypothetical protein